MGWRIRTGLGPQATADRRKYKLDVLEQEEKLALEKEKTKQLTKGDAEVAAALLGGAQVVTTPAPAGMFDFSDPGTQLGAFFLVVGGGLAARKYWG